MTTTSTGVTVTAEVTDEQLRELFAVHCECRPLDLLRHPNDHAAILDCDAAILLDIQVALFDVNSVGADERRSAARARCAALLTARRTAEGGG